MSLSRDKECPVDHQLLQEQQRAQSQARADAAGGHNDGKCPVDHSAIVNGKQGSGKCPVDHSALGNGKQEGGKCPVDHAALSAIPGGLKNGKPAKAVCPFGFGSKEAGGPTMTSLHCPKCKALFFDCVQTNCEHHFCRNCISLTKECLACGDKVTELEPDQKVQDLVDTFIATHSSDPKFVEDKGAAGARQDPEAVEAEFLLETALQSMGGGNLQAAFQRLQLCKAHLLRMKESRGDDPDLAVQLGAVCGSQGDCQAQMGAAEQSALGYKDSIRYLESCPNKAPEVQKALTVTLNKLGDLHYRMGDFAAARDSYIHALKMRREIFEMSEKASKWPAELDIAFSLAKAADIEQVLSNPSAAGTMLQEAKKIAAGLKDYKDQLDAAATKRLASLEAFLSKQTT